MLNKRLIALALFFIVTPLVSQKITHYGFKEGLEEEDITYINQGNDGVLWMGSKNGQVTSFNGWNFKQIRLPGNIIGEVKKISTSEFGIRIISTEGILNFHEGASTVLYDGNIQSVVDLGDSILFVDNQNQLRMYSVLNGNVQTLRDGVKSIVSVNVKNFILAESNNLFSTEDNANNPLHDFKQAPVFEWSETRLQLVEGRLVQIPIRLLSNIPKEIDLSKIQQILDGGKSIVWLRINNELLKIESGKITEYSSDLNFTDGLVQYIFKDYEDNIWAGTSNGLYKIQNNGFQFVGEVEPTDRITTISKGWINQIWLGTERGKLFSYTGKSIQKDKTFDKVIRESINSAYYDSGDDKLWLTTDHNWLLKLNSDRSYNRYINRNAVNGNAAFQIFNDDKEIWIASLNRIFKLPDPLVNEFLELTSSIDNHSILAVYKKSATSIIILSADNIYVISENSSTAVPIKFKNLKDKIFTCFEVDKMGKFWIGTWGNGLIYLDDGNTYRTISIKEGLNSDIVLNLLSTRNSIFVGTPRGIDKVEIQPQNQVSIRHLIDEIVPTNLNTFFLEENSNLVWFGSGSKCYTYPLDAEFKKSGTVSITKAIFFGTNLSDTIISTSKLEKPFSLSHKQNTVEFQFLGVSLSYPEGVSYATRLIGRDSAWTYPIKERSVRYNVLQPGNYKFEVMMYSPEGVPGNSIASLDFSIASPLWKDPWVLIGVVALLISSSWMVIRIRERNKLHEMISKEKRKSEMTDLIRKEIARDFHDNIGNKLAGLKVASNLIRMKLKDNNKEVSNLLHDIEKDSQDLFDGTRDFIWSIDPESDNLLEVFSYIKDFGEKTFERSLFTFLSSQKIQPQSIIKIPTGWSRQIVMIFKEAMTNSLKHSQGNTIEFLLLHDHNRYKFLYIDNGKYDGSKNFSGRGMKNMTDRATSIGGHLEFNIGIDFQIALSLSLTKTK